MCVNMVDNKGKKFVTLYFLIYYNECHDIFRTKNFIDLRHLDYPCRLIKKDMIWIE